MKRMNFLLMGLVSVAVALGSVLYMASCGNVGDLDDVIIVPPGSSSSSSSGGGGSTNTFGLYSETTPENVTWDTDAKMDVWNDQWNSGGCLFDDDTTTFADGINSLKITGIAGKSWFGIGMRVEPEANYKDMSSFSNSVLKFWYKSSRGIKQVGIKSGPSTERWVTGANCVSLYGMKTDDTWSEVSIPVSVFTGIDFSQISQYFMIVADGANYAEGYVWNIDNIYYTNL